MIFSSFYLGICGVFLALTASFLLGIDTNVYLLLIVFMTITSIYTFNKLSEKEDKISYPERYEFINKYKKLMLIYGVLFYISALISAFLLNHMVFLVIFSLSVLVILYSIKTPFGRIKDVFIIKNVFVSFIWSLVPLLVIVNSHKPITLYGIIFMFFIFSRVFINNVFFDTRDIESDIKSGANTIPAKFGINKTLKFLHAINILSIIPILMMTYLFSKPKLLTLAILIIYDIFYFKLYNKGLNKIILYDIIAESEFIMMFIISFIITLIP